MKLTRRQEENLAKTFFDIAKICFATLIIGSLASNEFKVGLFLSGIISFAALVIAGLIIDRGDKES